MFLKGYTTFHINTQPFNWDVNRRFKDFEWLRQCLVNRYCASIVACLYQVPYLPSKTLYSNYSETTEYRQQSFQDFLSFILNHKTLVYSPELLAFLKLPDTEFEKMRDKAQFGPFIPPAKDFMCKGKSKELSSVATATGIVEGRLDSNIRKLSRDVSILIVDTFSHFEEAVTICKQVEHHLEKLTECYSKLANQAEAIACKFNLVSEVNKFESFGRIGELYSSLSESFFTQATVTRDEQVTFGNHITMMLDFDLKEVEGLEEVVLDD